MIVITIMTGFLNGKEIGIETHLFEGRTEIAEE